jgi:tRNA (cytidine/uridine-2'-O-)-methyltransferase
MAMLKVVLYQPEIHWNTGNVGRTCVAAGAELHLIEPLGFDLSDKQIRRAGLDYWKDLKLTVHSSLAAWEAALPPGAAVFAFSAQAKNAYWDCSFPQDAWLLFGRESTGLPPAVLSKYPGCRIPIRPEVRSLNLSTAAAIAVYFVISP